jgi:hypothetical protein
MCEITTNMKPEIKYYQSRVARITGTNYTEIRSKAQALYRDIDVQTGNRNTYVRSAYFGKQKVFLKTFWNHLLISVWAYANSACRTMRRRLIY